MYISNPPPKSKLRISSDSAWPLRNSDGKTFAEARKEKAHDDGINDALKCSNQGARRSH